MKRTILSFAMVLFAISFWGCNTFSPAEVPHDQRTAVVVTPESVEVLKQAIDADAQVLASSLEQMQDEGSVMYLSHDGIVYNPDGTPFVLENGQIVRIKTKFIAKLNSLASVKSMEGVDKLKWVVGGYDYLDMMPEGIMNRDLVPEVMRLEVERADSATADRDAAEIVAAYAAEKGAIFQGIVERTRARGDVFAVGVEAIGNQLVRITTAVGKQIVGRITGTYAVDMAVEGVSDLLGFTLETDGGEVIKAVTEGAANVSCVNGNCDVP